MGTAGAQRPKGTRRGGFQPSEKHSPGGKVSRRMPRRMRGRSSARLWPQGGTPKTLHRRPPAGRADLEEESYGTSEDHRRRSGGCEAAWAAGPAGHPGGAHEMKPEKMTPAHHSPEFAGAGVLQLPAAPTSWRTRWDAEGGAAPLRLSHHGPVRMPTGWRRGAPWRWTAAPSHRQ